MRVLRLLSVYFLRLITTVITIPPTSSRVSSDTPIILILKYEVVPLIVNRYGFFN